MAASVSSFKVESGIQLLARLSKKPSIENFYPVLFECGPRQSEVIEIYSDDEITSLLVDITCDALLHTYIKDMESGVLIFNCSGHFNYDILISSLQKKIKSRYNVTNSSLCNMKTDEVLRKALNNLFLVEIYDSNQFYTTICNLDNILMEHSNISMVIFDTVTAFYWSEQSSRMMKMDTYLKKTLNKIQRVTKEHKVTLIYTRPEHFSSNRDVIESLESCVEKPTLDKLNYRIHIAYSNNSNFNVTIKTFKKQFVKQFCIVDNNILWV